MGQLIGKLSQCWNKIQGSLFPWPGRRKLKQIFESYRFKGVICSFYKP
jgi:hypothetical protein